jgi:hypothetical protein
MDFNASLVLDFGEVYIKAVISDILAVRRVAFSISLYTDGVCVKGIVESFNG